MLPVSVQPTDEDGNSGAEQDTAPQTGSDRPDEAMTEIVSRASFTYGYVFMTRSRKKNINQSRS